MSNLITEMRKLLNEFEIENVTEENYKELTDLYETNRDYFLLTEGEKSSVENCLTDIKSVPPGFDIRNKYSIAFKQNGRAVALMDILAGYPSPDVVWIGFLLVHGDWKRKQIGKKIVTALLDASNILGINKFQLGVIENNSAGLAFWDKMGFKKLKESQAEMSGGKIAKIIVMERV